VSGLRRWLFVIAGMLAFAVLLLGALVGGGPALAPPPATPTPAAALPSATAQPTGGPVQQAPDRDRIWVYFARDQLPPLGAYIRGIFQDDGRPESRIQSRIGELQRTRADAVPAGAMNLIPLIGRFEQTATGSQGSTEIGGRVDGDLATIEFGAGHFDRIRGAAMTQALLQQLVYTVTEEPLIRRVLLAERGGGRLTIDQLVIDKPLTREDVVGYSFAGTKTSKIDGDGTEIGLDVTKWSVENEQTPGLGRFSVELRARGPVPGGRLDPRFSATISACDGCSGADGKWWISLRLPDAVRPPGPGPSETLESGPIRVIGGEPVIDSRPQGLGGVTFTIKVEDARPWRVAMEPIGEGAARLYVDVGGRPSTVNENIAVYLPVPEQGAGDRATGCTCTVRGVARVFEANVVWRVRDGNGREVSRGNTTASRGTSPVWGVFETPVTIPPGTAGQPTVEVFWASPRDGSEQDIVSIPLTLR